MGKRVKSSGNPIGQGPVSGEREFRGTGMRSDAVFSWIFGKQAGYASVYVRMYPECGTKMLREGSHRYDLWKTREEGYLINPNDWSEEVTAAMAAQQSQEDHVELSETQLGLTQFFRGYFVSAAYSLAHSRAFGSPRSAL